MARLLTEAEAEAYLENLLRERGRMTTRMIDETVQDRAVQCPEGTLKHLNRLRIKGVIKGAVSPKHRGWVWWVEDTEATDD